MSQNRNRVANEVPVGFWDTMRAYTKVLCVEGEAHASLSPVTWQWRAMLREVSEADIEKHWFHFSWKAVASYGGRVIDASLRATEFGSDPKNWPNPHFRLGAKLYQPHDRSDIPDEENAIAGMSKIFAYKITPHFIGASILFGESCLSTSTLTHLDVNDYEVCDDEADIELLKMREPSPEFESLHTPSSDDYGELLTYMRLALRTDRYPIELS